jgi:multidrug efflux pump subunit AcrA (membrane-fusion protein)
MSSEKLLRQLPKVAPVVVLAAWASLALTGCKAKDEGNAAPPQVQVATRGDMSVVSVDKPNQFPLVAAESYDARGELDVTGSVFPDVAREIPVISLASGRVVDIKARLDDYVQKGQLLLKIQSPGGGLRGFELGFFGQPGLTMGKLAGERRGPVSHGPLRTSSRRSKNAVKSISF